MYETMWETLFFGGQEPASTALLNTDGTILSYANLRLQIGYLVRLLNLRGFRPNDRVAVMVRNGPEMAVAMLSTMAGFACAPLSPGLKAAEVEQRLSNMKASCAIVQSGMNAPIIEIAERLGIYVVEFEAGMRGAGSFVLKGEDQPPEQEPLWTDKDNIAMVLHTSGTTARPKLVALSNSAVVHSVTVIREVLGLDAMDRGLNMLPLSHVHGQIVVFAGLAAGGSVVCAPGFDPAAFYRWLVELSPTWYSAVPTIHRAILDLAPGNTAAIARARLRFIRSASSPLPVRWMRELEGTFKLPVVEAYGMTEASHGITSNPLPPLVRKEGSVGIPFRGEELKVVGGDGKNLGEGEIGEILIRGKNVITAYEDNPEANARSFSGGWLRTGDLGYLDSDGYLFIKGRVKELINRGGEKISPIEVEEALMANDSVSEAIVFSVPHPTLGEDVAAAVVPKTGRSLDEKSLRSELLTKLAEHKVPQRIVFVGEIPKGSMGKPQRGGMAERLGVGPMQVSKGDGGLRADAELAGMADRILGIWRAVLRRDDVSVGQSFLEAGGDSLRAMQVVVRLREAFGVDVDVAALFEADTVEKQAKLVRARLEKAGTRGVVDGPR